MPRKKRSNIGAISDVVLGTDFKYSFEGTDETKKRRVTLKPKERIYVWEHSGMYGRTCNICNERITKLSDLELDHTKPYSKGGKKLNLAHRDCNRMKGSRSLKDVQTKMGFETPKKIKSKPKRKAKKKETSDFDLHKTKFPKTPF